MFPIPEQPKPRTGNAKRLALWVGGAGAVMFVLLVVVGLVAPPPEDDGERAAPAAETTSTPPPSASPSTSSPEPTTARTTPTTPPPATTSSTPKPTPTATREPGHVTPADLDPWPFTARAGVIACLPGDRITFRPTPPDGRVYALNGAAQALEGTTPMRPDTPMWRDDKKTMREIEQAGGTAPRLKIPLGAAIAYGLDRCQ